VITRTEGWFWRVHD